jgi:exodeoxyribonuclease VII large subunit
VSRLRARVAASATRRPAACARRPAHEALRLRGLARSLEAISPLATDARGYSILPREDGAIVRRVDEVSVGGAVTARVGDGDLRLRVEAREPSA